MVISNKKDEYSCPTCGCLAPKKNYGFNFITKKYDRKFAYKFENGRLKLPLEKRIKIICCNEKYLAPYHHDEQAYLNKIVDIISFHIGEEWVDDYLYSNTTNK